MKNKSTSLLALVVISLIQVSLSAMPVEGQTSEAPVSKEKETGVIVSEEAFYESSDEPIPPADALPALYSKGAIKQYVMKNITHGFMWVDVENGENYSRTFYGDTPQQIINQINSHEITIKTIRPEEEDINIYVSLSGSENATYFSSSTSVTLEERSDGSWSFNVPPMTLVMQEHIKMQMPDAPGDVEDVNIRVRDEYGYVIDTRELGHYKRSFYFPTRFAGQFGEVVFIDSKGQEFSYDLQSGQRLTEESFEIEQEVSIDNYKELSLEGGTKQDFWPTSLRADDGTRRTAPVYYLVVKEATTFVVSSYLYESIDGVTDEVRIHHPQRAWLEKVGNSFEEEVFYRNGLEVELEPGKYYLRLEYEVLEEGGYNAPSAKG